MHKPLEICLVDGSRVVNYTELRDYPHPVSNSDRVFPIHHEYLVSLVLESAMAEGFRLKDSLYSTSHGGFRFFGLFQFAEKDMAVNFPPPSPSQIGWIVGASNANDGTDGVLMWSGVRIVDTNAIAFNDELTIAKRHTEDAMLALPDQIRGGMRKMHEHWNINAERFDCYAEQSLTIEDAHHLICTAIKEEVIAGREINALLTLYHKTRGRGRGLWTLFSCCVQILNKLKTPQMIERTIQLHNLFDQFAKFNKRPSPWIQTRFA